MDELYSLAHHGRVSREDFSLIYRQISQGGLVGGSESLRRSRLTGLDAPSFNHQFDRGENGSILDKLGPALGVGVLGIGRLGRN